MSGGVYFPDAEIGRVITCSSDPEGGSCDVGALLRISDSDFIWCGEITRSEAEDAGVSVAGWHVVLHQGADRTVIAQVHDSYSGVELIDAIAAALRVRPTDEALK